MPTWDSSNSFRYDDLTEEQKSVGGYRRLGGTPNCWEYDTGDEQTATKRTCVFYRDPDTLSKTWIWPNA